MHKKITIKKVSTKKFPKIEDYAWGWRSMWVIALYDLPTNDSIERRHYSQFHKALLKDGFTMMQYSVYNRHCASMENAEVHMQRVEALLPPNGQVQVFTITDHQFGKIRTFVGKKREKPPQTPAQLEIF